MFATGVFTFKSFKEREAGRFITSDGETIEYEASHILKFDEISEDGNVHERKAKVEIDNFSLISKLSKLKIYQPVTLKFKIFLIKDGRSGYLELVDVLDEKKQKNEEQKENQEN